MWFNIQNENTNRYGHLTAAELIKREDFVYLKRHVKSVKRHESAKASSA